MSNAAAEDDSRQESVSSVSFLVRDGAVERTWRKSSHVADRLAAIREQLAARTCGNGSTAPLQHSHEDPSIDYNLNASERQGSRSIESLKLPLLSHLPQRTASNQSSFFARDQLEDRASRQDRFVSDAERVARAEDAAVQALQDADRLAEEARIAMLMYSQHEKSWSFDERTNRYQQAMIIKSKADASRRHANDVKLSAQEQRSRLAHPYEELRAAPSLKTTPRRVPALMSSGAPVVIARDESMFVWVLAAVSPHLTFTPRATTPLSMQLQAEKELSTHVVYYVAASRLNDSKAFAEDEWACALAEDSPPCEGWICCSTHGAAPPPVLIPLKASMETWIISGAGAGHVNGKYIISGVHDSAHKFKATSGVELFRKRLPRSSTVAEGLHDDLDVQETVLADANMLIKKVGEGGNAQRRLPTALQHIESDDNNFESLRRIGTWMQANEVREKHRRRKALEAAKQRQAASGESNEQLVSNEHLAQIQEDGDNIMSQSQHRLVAASDDIAESRPEASAELCREWVLFMMCSRRLDPKGEKSVRSSEVKGIGCLKRHFYISVEEKQTMTIWAQEQESWLEKDVLYAIIKREAHIARVQVLCAKCMSNFQQNLSLETQKVARKILMELSHIRFLSVRVLESIQLWRDHARKLGFVRFDGLNKNVIKAATQPDANKNNEEVEPAILGWSASITMPTGRKLFRGSRAYVSLVKRFCRPEDATGKQEQHVIYLGYFPTRMEAERAYDEYATAQARKLNTTAEHLPHRRNVFRSCGKHFAVESERIGPSFCIECKELASTTAASVDAWMPPFFYVPEENYILKMGSDLDFLDNVPPIKSILNDGHGTVVDEVFPLIGNAFLLPKTPVQDPSLAFFVANGMTQAPQLQDEESQVDDVALDRDRILRVQHIFLQEIQIYHPELFANSVIPERASNKSIKESEQQRRLVEALYWDRCAALKITQERDLLVFRQPNVWCRPDVGEWSSLLVRGKHLQHFLFEANMAAAGKERHQKRQMILKALRRLNKVPLYAIHSRDSITRLIGEGYQVKGDVVLLEVKRSTKFLETYDVWCATTQTLQRWYRGVRGRCRAKLRRKILQLTCKLRKMYTANVAAVATTFYQQQVITAALKSAVKVITKPFFSRAIKLDGEYIIVSFHSLERYERNDLKAMSANSSCCVSCARRFCVRAHYDCSRERFIVPTCVCTCSYYGGRSASQIIESWLLRGYNPVSNVIYRAKIENSMLKQLLLSNSSELYNDLLVQGQRNIDRYRTSIPWNLVHQREARRKEAVAMILHLNHRQAQASAALSELMNWRLLSSEATQRRKLSTLAMDKSTAKVWDVKTDFASSADKARKALDFTSRPFHEAQAWDPLENANDWRTLVRKRQLEKDLASAEREQEISRLAVFQAHFNEQYLRVRATQALASYDQCWRPLLRYESQRMDDSGSLENCARVVLDHSIKYVLKNLLSLHDTNRLPTRRQLVIQGSIWEKMNSMRAAIPGLRRGCNTVIQRAIVLSNLSRKDNVRKRMVVGVHLWIPSVRGTKEQSLSNGCCWVTAYNPASCQLQEIYLQPEMMQLLTSVRAEKLSQMMATRSTRHGIAEKIMSITMLDRFTCEFTLQKLQFYHHMRLLFPQLIASKWYRDLSRGRKSGPGDEILRQGVAIDGKLCMVTVFENWGDLEFAIYHPPSGKSYRINLLFCDTLRLLYRKPLVLHLWICCVKANNYVPLVIIHILKHLRWNDQDDTSKKLSSTTLFVESFHQTTRFRKVMTIESRKMLVRISEGAIGDFCVSAFDWQQNHAYKLHLELENIRRLLLRSNRASVRTNSRSNSSNLLLERNRLHLFEWICSRLRFQSLLSHPDILMSSQTPLIFGAYIRKSFLIFNDWIRSSTRNPLTIVSDHDIDSWAVSSDTEVFSKLQFDQLVLIPTDGVPYVYDKNQLGTFDWRLTILSAQSGRKHLKMDILYKGHDLFACVRTEILIETERRREKSTRLALDHEEKSTILFELQSLLMTLTGEFADWIEHLGRMNKIIKAKRLQWRMIHIELLDKMTKRGDESTEEKEHEAHALNATPEKELLKCDVTIPSSDLRSFFHCVDSCAPDFFFALRDFLVPVANLLICAPDVLNRLVHEIDGNILVQLNIWKEKIGRATLEMSTRDVLYELLHELNYFAETMSLHRLHVELESVLAVIKSEAEAFNEVRATEKDLAADQRKNLDLEDHSYGVLIPSSHEEPIQEIYITDHVVYSGSISSQINSLARSLKMCFENKALSKQRRTSEVKVTGKWVFGGILLYQDISSSIIPTIGINPRASAIAGVDGIRGIAVYYPLFTSARTPATMRYHEANALYEQLISISTPNLSGKSAKHSRTILPWKQFSALRTKAARAVRQNQAKENLFLDSFDLEKDDAAIATLCIPARQLEVMYGASHWKELDASNLDDLASKIVANASANRRGPIVLLKNPLVLGNLWTTEEIAATEDSTIPCESGSCTLRKNHLHVEVDDWQRPRRIIFFCRELQSQRRYAVDCSYFQLQQMVAQRLYDGKSSVLCWPMPHLTVADWRAAAKLAASFLVMRKRNGVLTLTFSAIIGQNANATKDSCAVDDIKAIDTAASNNTLCQKLSSTHSNYENHCLKELVYRCKWRRYEKHQQTVRRHTCTKFVEQQREDTQMRHRAHEWMRMTQEDWRAYEFRGIFALDAKHIKHLRKAYTTESKRYEDAHRQSSSTEGASRVELQVKEIAKFMGGKAIAALSSEVLLLQVREIQQMIWWKQKHKLDIVGVSEAMKLDFVETAEWWRRLLIISKTLTTTAASSEEIPKT